MASPLAGRTVALAEVRQLEELGFEFVECLACDGRTVGPGGSGDSDSLHYVARRA